MTSGNNNIGFGYQTLYEDTSGSNNIAMGYQSAYYVQSGSNTIEIGNAGTQADNNLIRIGTQGTQTTTYVAGISDAQVTGSAVYVTSAGQLGVLASSERYKIAIAPIGKDSRKLEQLRPVRFRLKTDPNGATQYGLIAEEVNKVYPELVIRDDKGKIQGVRYDELAPLLLNEMQKQQLVNSLQTQKIDAQARMSEEQTATIAAQSAELQDLKQRVVEMQAWLLKLQPTDQLVAHQ
jgi:hypothetical protein